MPLSAAFHFFSPFHYEKEISYTNSSLIQFFLLSHILFSLSSPSLTPLSWLYS